MTTLDLPWYGNNQARYQAEVLNFLQQNPDAVAKEWAEIVLHTAGARGGTAGSEHHIPVGVKGDAGRIAVVVAGAIVGELKTRPGPNPSAGPSAFLLTPAQTFSRGGWRFKVDEIDRWCQRSAPRPGR